MATNPMRKQAILAVALLAILFGAAQTSVTGQAVLHLWPGGVPGPQNATGTEHDLTKPSDALIGGKRVARITDVSDPTLTLYPAPQDTNTGATVVVAPGGGYKLLAYDLEGIEVCTWLNSIGVNCALLKYRVPSAANAPNYQAPLQDAQRGIALLRSHATEWHLDPKRIGILGFSAGGHLAAVLSVHRERRAYHIVDAADRENIRPDFALLIYPAHLTAKEQFHMLAPELEVTAVTPPTFLIQAEDDPVHVENSLIYYAALKAENIPAEMHLYSQGGHGYGLRTTDLPVTRWPQLAEAWLRALGMLAK